MLQADVCHAYHILRSHGIPEEHIITMMYDDIANNERNPYPGKIYNKPHGEELYTGVKIDYKGDDVTPQNFLAILEGNASAVTGGNKRVVRSNAHDHIFVYFSDHGASGLIAFPNEMLTAGDLNSALKRMYRRRRYDQLVFYLEACESGSMFNGILPADIGVYVITAANDHESSWGYYCDNDMRLPCMGDQFSINWMEDSDVEQLNKESLQQQYEIVVQKTNLSHVMHYGDLSIAKEFVADFQGWEMEPQSRVSTLPGTTNISMACEGYPTSDARQTITSRSRQQKKKRNKKENRQASAKARISRQLHDRLGGGNHSRSD
uniref:legumain n=1 Tax=Parascaris univalens TaxID=6257 RepID=A0A915C5K8_PARUN